MLLEEEEAALDLCLCPQSRSLETLVRKCPSEALGREREMLLALLTGQTSRVWYFHRSFLHRDFS
jgi:hypothetical protein